MEEKINIAEILKDKKNGLRLYSPIFGECAFCHVRKDTNDICVKKHNGVKEFFDSKGLYYNTGEVMLFPSKSMRDWDKFSWNRGDVLISDCGFVCIFKEWASDDYTRFNGCYFDGMPNAQTAKYRKLDNNTAYGYIRELEKRCGGKLNLETLKIEKQYEFKDGDIAFAEYGNRQYVFIVSYKTNISEGYNSFISLDLSGLTLNIGYRTNFFKKYICKLRLATEEEKQQLFSALKKEGKRWDSDKKSIVDLKPKVELKPFDRVLVRDFEDQAWQVSLFSYKDSDSYYCCNGCAWNQCIPYIGNESFLGTTKDV